MPDAPKTPHRSIRVPDGTWIPVMDRAKDEGTSAGELCRQFLDWWLRKPGAKLPTRPDARERSHD